MLHLGLHPELMLAFFQGTQLNLFERFLTQAVSGIDSTGITAGMQNVAYVVLLVGFLWQLYQSLTHGGDVRGLGTGLIKYVVTAVVVMNYGSVFTTINQGFVNGGNWVSNASGGNVLQNWGTDLQAQFTQDGTQQLWGLITGSIAGLIDGLLIIVAYLLYPIVVVIFGFFYIFYGSVLYIFGPIVIALMPLGGVNRLAKAYVENIFVWNAWPILYGGFGALITAVQMGQVGQMLNQNDFLGGLGNLEGSFLIGIVSIVYSLAIAVIPFIAKRIVSGDVGSTAAAMLGAAVTAITAGAASIEGAAAGIATAGAGSSGGTPAGTTSGAATAGSGRALSALAGGNQPAPPQQAPVAASSQAGGYSLGESSPSLEGHAEQIRSSISDVTLLLLSGLVAIVLLQWRAADKREVIAASLIAQLWNGRVSDRIEIERRTQQFNLLVEAHNADVEKNLSQKPGPSQPDAEAAGSLTRRVRSLAESQGISPVEAEKIEASAPDATTASLQQNNLLLQRRVEALQNSEQNLKQRLNQTTVLLDQERRRNATLKGA